jgi:hypothetical protein
MCIYKILIIFNDESDKNLEKYFEKDEDDIVTDMK